MTNYTQIHILRENTLYELEDKLEYNLKAGWVIIQVYSYLGSEGLPRHIAVLGK